MQHTLRQIDRDLIELLGKKIAALSASGPALPEVASPELALLFEQTGLPEFVWRSLVISCAAAAAIKSSVSPSAQSRPRRVTIMGGDGLMGRFCTQRLAAAGHAVTILEQHDWERAQELLAPADLVLVCVPIECTVQVIRKAAQYLSPTTALADVTSIKTPALKAMLKYHPGPVMGLHPMFGPGVKSFLSQKVVVCPGRSEASFHWLLELIASEGGQLIFSTSEEHDQMMVAIQAIRNFATLSMGVFLSEDAIDIHRSLEFSSPLYRHKLAMVMRLFAQPASLVVDIILATPERREAIVRLAETYSRLAQLVQQGDRDRLIGEFKATRHCFADTLATGLEESTHVVDALSLLQAASRTKQPAARGLPSMPPTWGSPIASAHSGTNALSA